MHPRTENYLKKAEQIVRNWIYPEPLTLFLKKSFKSSPEMGSGDRKTVSNLVYAYFRMLPFLHGSESIREALILSWLAMRGPDKFGLTIAEGNLRNLEESDFGISPEERLEKMGFTARKNDGFPSLEDVSSEVDREALLAAMIRESSLFIRVRDPKVKKAFVDKGLSFNEIGNDTLQFSVGIRLETLEQEFPGSFEIQDLSSQQTLQLFRAQAGERWWDCCAASGGKSILLYDHFPQVKLFVSDVRQSILDSLSERFKRAGIRNYSRLCVDLETPDPLSNAGSFPKSFDAIIADVPCSGSGTWGRTPEVLGYFSSAEIAVYQKKQRLIMANVAPYLTDNGRLIYLTCSVYKQENEENLEWAKAKLGLKVQESHYFQNSHLGGDILFGAILTR